MLARVWLQDIFRDCWRRADRVFCVWAATLARLIGSVAEKLQQSPLVERLGHYCMVTAMAELFGLKLPSAESIFARIQQPSDGLLSAWPLGTIGVCSEVSRTPLRHPSSAPTRDPAPPAFYQKGAAAFYQKGYFLCTHLPCPVSTRVHTPVGPSVRAPIEVYTARSVRRSTLVGCP